MKIKSTSISFLILIIFFISCRGQGNIVSFPLPDSSYFEQRSTFEFEIGSIIETKSGTTAESIPEWLFAFLSGGVNEVERLYSFANKYVFVGTNMGENFTVLNKWADVFSARLDFPLLAALRIERRMISTSFLYPDDEYGLFFERLVKKAYTSEYPSVTKEDTYWIKIKVDNETDASREVYLFYVLISIDKPTMQFVVQNMITQTISAVSPGGSQAAAVNRLRQNFFEGF